MPISPENFLTLEDVANRLITESILAQSGRDDGLIPAYSLLSQLCETCGEEPALMEPLSSVRAALEKLLDTAQPFDEISLGQLRRLVEWFPVALAALKAHQAVPPFDGAPVEASEPAAAAVLLE